MELHDLYQILLGIRMYYQLQLKVAENVKT